MGNKKGTKIHGIPSCEQLMGEGHGIAWTSAWKDRGSFCIGTPKLSERHCPPSIRFFRAKHICEDMGARLCTSNELESKVGEQTSSVCNRPVWTSDEKCKKGSGRFAYLRRRVEGSAKQTPQIKGFPRGP